VDLRTRITETSSTGSVTDYSAMSNANRHSALVAASKQNTPA
jgi:hypothetical protein